MAKLNIAKMMTPTVLIALIDEEQTVRQGLEIMTHHGYTAIPVVDREGKYIGTVSEGDFLRHIMRTETVDKKFHEKFKIKEIYRKDFCPAINMETEESEVLQMILNQNFLPVIDGRGVLCGILTRKSVIEHLSK